MSHTERLVLTRHVAASTTRVFDAWIDPIQLRQWWGPRGVECFVADIDLRVGGTFRLGNRLPDDTVVWITGTYERIDRPTLLRFTWATDGEELANPSLVTVRFVERNGGTDVTISHERVPETRMQDHESGWTGCLVRLVDLLSPN